MLPLDRAIAFIAAAGLLAYLAFDGGGYDVVVRQRVALFVWVLVALGFLFGVLPRGQIPRIALIPAGCAAGLVVLFALSLSWTESDERTTAELARLLGYVGLLTLVFSSLNRDSLAAAAAGASVAAAVVVAVGLASRFFPDAFPGATDVASVFRQDRLDFPLDYWNAVGAWSAMAVAIGLSWSAHAARTPARAIALAAVPLAGTAVYLTYSRGGVVGAAVAVAAVLALSRNRWTAAAHAVVAAGATAVAILTIRQHDQIADATGGEGGTEVTIVLALVALACAGAAFLIRKAETDRLRLSPETARCALPAAAVLVVIATAVFARGTIERAWDEFRTEEHPAVSESDPAVRLTSGGGNRNDVWSSAIDSFEAHPLGGTGPGTFEFWWSRDARDPEFVRDAHSLYLESLAELGLPALLLILGLLGGLLLLALRIRRALSDPGDIGASVAMSAVFVVFLVNAGVDWMWEETAVGALGLGGAAIAGGGGPPLVRSANRPRCVPARAVRWAVVAVGLLAAAAQVPGMVMNERIEASQAAARAGDLPRSHALAEDAADAQPWAAAPYQQLALIEERLGDLAAARAHIRKAIEREPTNWRHPLILARVLDGMGEHDAARRVFREGRRLRPLSPSYLP
jgi:hypothetical protein